MVFQLKSNNRQAIDKQHHIHSFIAWGRIGYLTHTAKQILFKTLLDLFAAAGKRNGVEQIKMSAINVQAFFQQVQHAIFLYLAV